MPNNNNDFQEYMRRIISEMNFWKLPTYKDDFFSLQHIKFLLKFIFEIRFIYRVY